MGLSGGEVDAIAKSWATVYSAKDKNGDEFLIQLFTKFPDYANFFSAFKGKSLADIKASPQLRAVSSRIMDKMNEFVHSAGDEGKISGLLQAFAKQHIGFGVKHQQFESVKSIFGAYLASVGAGGGADAAWGKLFGIVVDAFKKAEA